MSQAEMSEKNVPLREEDVHDWLLNRPEFLQQHPDLLRTWNYRMNPARRFR